ncbi:hypothetical protein [Phytohalomonas tamaricis]|uniref:hypothetical protein n=1 Tax=Phytohalomonas tamaricis TaxID=2081032 RepID=UPI000D0B4C76|nr:hypothetical protein [Phytohalomonas tamaricis]
MGIPEIVAGVIALFGVMVGALGWMKSKKDTAEQKAGAAEDNLAAEKAARDKESEIRQSVEGAQDEAQQVEADYLTRRTNNDRPRAFGDARNTPAGMHDDADSDSKS